MQDNEREFKEKVREFRAKKHFGQNFLQDKSVLNKITQAISKETGLIVEIGPGLGDLTQELVKIAPVRSFEIDAELEALLKRRFKEQISSKALTLIHADASKIDTWAHEPYVMAANLPYYVATNLILRALEDSFCQGFVVMVQKEVALKFSAAAGEKEFSALSVITQALGACELLFDVSAEAFKPPPKVLSSVIRFQRALKPCELGDFDGFKAFLRKCFAAPRKQLLSAFKDEKERVKELFAHLNIKENARAHELGVKSYLEIFKSLKDKQ